jgi:hypothetical protein
VYRTGGLSAAIFATMTSHLILASEVGLHLGNQRFLYSSLAILAIPVLLWCGALAATVVSPAARRLSRRQAAS